MRSRAPLFTISSRVTMVMTAGESRMVVEVFVATKVCTFNRSSSESSVMSGNGAGGGGSSAAGCDSKATKRHRFINAGSLPDLEIISGDGGSGQDRLPG